MPERAPLAPLGASLAHRDAQAASRPRPATGPARKPAPPSSSSPTKQIANGDITPVFAAMLDKLEVPPSTRAKLLSLTPSVQYSMLKGKESLDLSDFDALTGKPSPAAPAPGPGLGLGRPPVPPSSPVRSTARSETASSTRPSSPSKLFGRRSISPTKMRLPSPSKRTGDRRSASPTKMGKLFSSRGTEMTVSSPVPEPPKVVQPKPIQTPGFVQSAVSSWSRKTGAPKTPVYFADLLKRSTAQHLDVGEVKRLRAALAAESPLWIETFGTQQGGYRALLNRLGDLLSLEWREEQHDDQLLYELLRSLVILSTSARGKSLLSSEAPTPFVALTELLWSEKKPGDLYVRKLLLDLLLVAGDLDIPSSRLQGIQDARQESGCSDRCAQLASIGALTPAEHLVIILLHSPRDENQEALVDFIRVAHTPRPLKKMVYDMARVVSDYFWVFCHSRNMIWQFDEMDPRAVDAAAQPKVPGGMTGGVEFEAMAYLTAHMKLINWAVLTLTRAEFGSGQGTWIAPRTLIKGMLDCGMDRILHSVRQASQTYYQPMHLELSIFYHQAAQAQYQLPHELTAWVGGAPVPPALLSPRKPITTATPIADRFAANQAL